MRIILWALGGVMTLVLVAIAGLYLFFDPNHYRDTITQTVKEQTGRPFSVAGDIGWSLFPRLSLDVGAIELGSGPGFADTPLIRAEGVSLGLEIMPLLQGELALEALRLRAPEINLVRKANGETNWQGLVPSQSSSTGTTAKATQSENRSAPTWLAGLSLGGIDLSNGAFRYIDSLNDQRIEAEELTLTLAALHLGEPTAISASAEITRNGQLISSSLSGAIVVTANGNAAIRDLDLRANDWRIDQLNTDITRTASGWAIQPITARAFEGHYQGAIRLNTQNAGLPVQFDERLSDAQIGPIITALTGFERIVGRAQIQASGDLALASDTPVGSLNSDAQIRIEDGAIEGINITRAIRHALARLQGGQPPATQPDASTAFTQLNAGITVRNGVARSDDISLDSPLLRLRGKGQSDLVNETLDLALTVQLIGSLDGAQTSALESLQGVPIPLRITGDWAAPKVRVDIAAVIQQTQGDRIREKINDEVDRLRNQLEGLFNQ